MDRRQRNKIVRLAARAGAMLEDASAAVLLLADVSDDDLASALKRERAVIARAGRLLDDAIALAPIIFDLKLTSKARDEPVN